MELQFAPVESHLYQQIMFPSMLEDTLPDLPQDVLFPGEAGDLRRDWLFALRSALLQREQVIRKYFSSDFALPLALIPEHFLSEGDYLALLKLLEELDPKEAAERVIHFLVEKSGKALQGEKVEQIIQHDDARRQFLEENVESPKNRWLLYNFLSSPADSLEELHRLYSELRLLSDALLGPGETEAWQSVLKLQEILDEDPEALTEFSRTFSLEEYAGDTDKIKILCSQSPFQVRFLPRQKMLAVGRDIPRLIKTLRHNREDRREKIRRFCFALGDERRIQLCFMLSSGSRKQLQLAEDLDLTQGTISHHLRVLREGGILKDRGAALDKEAIRAMLATLSEELQLYS